MRHFHQPLSTISIKSGYLHVHSGVSMREAEEAKQQGKRVDRGWRQVPRTEEQRGRIIQSCHSSLEGINISQVVVRALLQN